MIDTLSLFLAGVSVEKAESERYPALAIVERESFGHPRHLRMLMDHAVETARTARIAQRKGDADGAERLRLAHAEYTSHRSTTPRSTT